MFDLTEDVKNRILALTRAFGLEYGSLDFIVDKNDKVVFLEVNPTGDRTYIEDATGMPITEAVVNLITKANTTTLLSSSIAEVKSFDASQDISSTNNQLSKFENN